MNRPAGNVSFPELAEEIIFDLRTTGDGYYESCVYGFEGKQIEITV